jgi:hypothetical protein
MVFIHVAQRDDVFTGDGAEVRLAAAPGADERDIELVAGRIRPEQFRVRKNECASSPSGLKYDSGGGSGWAFPCASGKIIFPQRVTTATGCRKPWRCVFSQS